jgi:hypothetical protein
MSSSDSPRDESSSSQRRARDLKVSVVLECGHTIRMRNRPWREEARFSCRVGLGCGYRLWWVSWVDRDFGSLNENRLYAERKRRESGA